jgi:sortase A
VGAAAAAAPTGAYLTLTTCHPKYSARQRLIVHAVLDGGAVGKAEAPDGPPALTEG